MKMMRICKTCGVEKQLHDFPVHHRENNGVIFYRHKCKSCKGVECKERYQRSDRCRKAREKKVLREQKYKGLMRVCNKCGLEKEASGFPEHKKRHAICLDCRAERQREWNCGHKREKKKIARKYVQGNRFAIALKSSQAQAKRGEYLPCNSTPGEISAAFTGRCHVCGVPEAECVRRLSMDHCHETGEFRGWLCDNCNRALGHMRDSPNLILSLLQYTEQSQGASVL